MQPSTKALPARQATLHVRISQFDDAHELTHYSHDIAIDGTTLRTVEFAGADWQVAVSLMPVIARPDAVDGTAVFRVTGGSAHDVAVAVECHFSGWTRDHFVMAPAAAYNGNRFTCRPYKYPPMVHEARDIGPGAPIVITDVPRLNIEPNAFSRLQMLTGDVTTPCLSAYSPHDSTAYILLTEQGSRLGNHGLTIEESDDRASAVWRIEAPGMRRDTMYTFATTQTPSWDRGANWQAGDEIVIRFRLFTFTALAVQDLYDRFAVVRKDLSGPVALHHELPFSAAWDIIEDKYQRDNWNDEGYYMVGTRDVAADQRYQDWQVGWVGGGMVPFPMLLAGQPESRQHAVTNIEWMFSQAQYIGGLLHAVRHHGKAYGDGFDTPGTETWLMVRKQVDALYFIIKTFRLLHTLDKNWQLPLYWGLGTRELADGLVKAFERSGELGQYIDLESGDVVVSGSTASAMGPAAFALAAQYYGNERYLRAAEALAAQLDARDVRAGITVGGPGEILKCPDSESAFAMLESFIVLYEVTGKRDWLARAEAMATQCMTWCASYDHTFPPDSGMGRIGAHAAGSVWANVQNKHSAPGICTLSGDSLFKLFRYTGNRLYLEQIQETAHNITQYLSRADRPVGDPHIMKPGWMCERVNFSDWEGRDNIGGSLFGSCWPEVSMMLTTVELPGLYAQVDTGMLCVIDHVDARITARDDDAMTVAVANPTRFDARVRVFAETSTAATTILGQAAAVRWPVITISAGETRVVQMTKDGRVA